MNLGIVYRGEGGALMLCKLLDDTAEFGRLSDGAKIYDSLEDNKAEVVDYDDSAATGVVVLRSLFSYSFFKAPEEVKLGIGVEEFPSTACEAVEYMLKHSGAANAFVEAIREEAAKVVSRSAGNN